MVASVFAGVPRTMTYQGKLTDTQGNALTGTYDFIFKVYDAALSGNTLWTEAQTGITVSGGMYNVMLGGNAPLSLAFDADYWLEIQVKPSLSSSSYETLLPRIKLVSSAYAMRSEYANTASSLSSASWTELTNGSVTTLHSHAAGQQGSVGGYQIIDGTITAADIANNTITPVKLSTAAVYNLYGSTLTVFSVVASSGITAARFYGDGAGLTGITGAIDAQVRVSTGSIKNQLDQVALSTGTLLRLNGTQPMSGKLDLGGNDATNVYTLTASSVSAYYIRVSTLSVENISSPSGLIVLLYADDTDGTLVDSTTSETVSKSYALSSNRYRSIIVESDVKLTNTNNGDCTYTVNLKIQGGSSRSYTMTLLAGSSVQSMMKYTLTQNAAGTVQVTVTPGTNSNKCSGLAKSLRVYGVMQ